ncbi:hypothetical protein ACC848_44160, partial [Rhizobium johnstonii]
MLELTALDAKFGDGPHLLPEDPFVFQISVDPFQNPHSTALRHFRPDPTAHLLTGLPERLRREI